MPTVEPPTAPSAGAISFHYTISTPTCASASTIDPALPTLLFLHSVYGDQVMLHCQFADCNVRRYNCVAVDLREHGLTTNAPVQEGYGVREGAEDVAAFMDALELPPCHVVGTSMGTIHGVALAVHYPDKVKSLFLISPLCTEEPEYVKDGRREITQIWEEGMRQDPPDEVMLKDAVFGVTQMALSGMPTDSMMNAMLSHTLSVSMSRWTPPRFPSLEHIALDFFCDKGDFDLTGINPALKVFMVHGALDIAYSTEMVLEFRKQLEDAGVCDVGMVDLENAPQYPWVGTHAKAVNGLLVDFVARVEGRDLPVPHGVTSPWADELKRFGWEAQSGEGGNEEEEEEDEDEVQIVYH